MPRNMSRSAIEGRLAAAREPEPRRADSAWCAIASRAERSARRDGSSRRAVTRSGLQTLLAVAVRHADQRSGACAVALPSGTGSPTRPISVVGLTEAVLAERRRRRWRGRRRGCRPGGWRRVRGSTRVRRGAAGRIWRGHRLAARTAGNIRSETVGRSMAFRLASSRRDSPTPAALPGSDRNRSGTVPRLGVSRLPDIARRRRVRRRAGTVASLLRSIAIRRASRPAG